MAAVDSNMRKARGRAKAAAAKKKTKDDPETPRPWKRARGASPRPAERRRPAATGATDESEFVMGEPDLR